MKSLSEMKARPGVALYCLGLTLIVSLPFFFIGEVPNSGCCGGAMPVTHDSAMHFNQMQSFQRGLAAGRIYPRWDDSTHAGFGAPTTSFYPPGVYYLTSFFYLTLGDWLHTMIALHLAMTAASGAAIYWYARETMARGASLMALSVYLIAPYHLINQYQRGAIAEQVSFIWAPLVLLFAERLLKGSKSLLSYAGLAAGFGAFLWSHPPTAYQFTLVFGICLAGWIGWKLLCDLRRFSAFRFLLVLTSMGFGSMLAAAYFFPAIFEQHLINADDVEKTWPYHSSYVFDFSQTVYNHKEGFFPRLDRIWLFSAVVIALASLMFLIFKRFSAVRAWLWIGAGIIALFLMSKFSYPIGKLIPKIEIGVFSWRMLAITSLVIALLAGELWQSAIDSQLARGLISGAASILILIAAVAVSWWYVIEPVYRGEAFKPIPEHYNYATLPRGVPREVPEMELSQLASGDNKVLIEEWRPEFRRLHIELDRPDQLQFRTSNFPGWTAMVDGKIAEIKNGDAGNIVVDLPPGKHEVELEFRSTPIRRASNWATVISFAVLVSLIIVAGRRHR